MCISIHIPIYVCMYLCEFVCSQLLISTIKLIKINQDADNAILN